MNHEHVEFDPQDAGCQGGGKSRHDIEIEDYDEVVGWQRTGTSPSLGVALRDRPVDHPQQRFWSRREQRYVHEDAAQRGFVQNRLF